MVKIEMCFTGGGALDGGIDIREFKSIEEIYSVINIYPNVQIATDNQAVIDGRYTLVEIKENKAIYKYQQSKWS